MYIACLIQVGVNTEWYQSYKVTLQTSLIIQERFDKSLSDDVPQSCNHFVKQDAFYCYGIKNDRETIPLTGSTTTSIVFPIIDTV